MGRRFSEDRQRRGNVSAGLGSQGAAAAVVCFHHLCLCANSGRNRCRTVLRCSLARCGHRRKGRSSFDCGVLIWLNCSMDRTARRLLEAWVPAHPAGHVQHPDYLKLLSDAVQFVHEWAMGSLSRRCWSTSSKIQLCFLAVCVSVKDAIFPFHPGFIATVSTLACALRCTSPDGSLILTLAENLRQLRS